MKICVVAGHTSKGTGTGAVGYINESTENRVVGKRVVEYLKQAGHTAVYGEINESSTYLADQVAIANKDDYDVVVQIHFNAGGGEGTETLYISNSGKAYAEKVTNSLGKMYKQRGAKYRNDLYWLKNTKAPAILVETCFVDSKTDTDKYNANKDYTARLIAEGIIGQEIKETTNTTTSSNTVYRVVVGSYSVKENADKALADAKAKGYTSAFILKGEV